MPNRPDWTPESLASCIAENVGALPAAVPMLRQAARNLAARRVEVTRLQLASAKKLDGRPLGEREATVIRDCFSFVVAMLMVGAVDAIAVDPRDLSDGDDGGGDEPTEPTPDFGSFSLPGVG